MKRRSLSVFMVAILVASAITVTAAGTALASGPTAVPGDPLAGSGSVTRTLATYAELTNGGYVSSGTISEDAFAVPTGAAPPSHTFQGTLTLNNATTTGGFAAQGGSTGEGSFNSFQKHLPDISAQFVQNGSYLIPVVQGLVVTGTGTTCTNATSCYSNYIIGPGRVWDETSASGDGVGDHGLSRASFPLTIVDRNQNCAHNGVVTFLFDNSTMSNARYQITAETCYLYKWDMYGQLGATYSPSVISNALALQNAEAAEITNRLPTKDISQLPVDYPGVNLQYTTTLAAAFSSGTNIKVTSVANLQAGQAIYIDSGTNQDARIISTVGTAGSGGTGVTLTASLSHTHTSGTSVVLLTFGDARESTAYGVYFGGTNYTGGCTTRQGSYAFCTEMRLPSYSLAKSLFSAMAMERLGQEYGSSVYNLNLRDFIPEMAASTTNWPAAQSITLNNAADMSTGNWTSKGYEVDEGNTTATNFLSNEAYSSKMTNALSYAHHTGQQGYTWQYETITQFLLTQAETGYLQSIRTSTADVWNMLRDEILTPLNVSAGALTTERTDNQAVQTGGNVSGSEKGRAWGAYGMFLTTDDMAKLAKLLNNDNGKINGVQVLDPKQVLASLQRLQSDRGVLASSTPLTGAFVTAGGYRYSNGFWSYPTTTAVAGCTLRVPFMSGYGGNSVGMYTNGSTYYVFSDANDFIWANTIAEMNTASPMCVATTTIVTSNASSQTTGQPVTFTATVTSTRNWAPTGTVQFKDGATNIGSAMWADANGQATYTTSALTAGSHTITAVFTPDPGASIASTTTNATAPTANCTTTDSYSLPVTSSAAFAVGDDVYFGTGTSVDELTVTSIPDSTHLVAVGFCTYYAHASGQTVTQRNSAGGGFNTSTSAGFTQTIGAVSTTSTTSIALTGGATPSKYGQALTYTATVTSGATGTVQFAVDGTNVGSAVTISGTTAVSASISNLTVGSHTVTAYYGGDGTYYPSGSSGLTQVVNQSVTSTTVTSDGTPSTLGNPVSFSATVAATVPGTGTPSGWVQFVVDGSDVGSLVSLSGGVANYVTSALTAGSHTIAAKFISDNGQYAASTSSNFAQAVSAASSTALALNSNPSAYGQSVTFTATVSGSSGTPTGTVQFTIDTVNSGSPVALSSGSATSVGVSNLALGDHSVVAVYSGDSTYAGSTSSTGTQTVGQAGATILLSNLAQAYDGTPKSATATTTPPDLTVDLTYDGSPTAPTNVGSYTVVGTINDPNYTGTSTDTLVISKGDQTIDFAPISDATYGDATFGISATATSGLLVALGATGNCSLDSATSPANVTITGAGSCTITASQAGNSNWNAATDVPRTFNIAKASQTITFATIGDATYGDPNFGISATSSSGLTVALGATGSCSLDSATSPANVTVTGAGSCTITASQAGDSNYDAATDVPRTFSVAKANQTITFATLPDKTFGDADFDVSASSSASLTVTFSAIGDCSMADADTAHITGAGTCEIKASQAGNANYNPASDVSHTFSIAKASATVQLSNLSQAYDGTPKSASTSTTPSGLSVSVTYDSSSSAPTNAGTYAVVATINDSNYEGTASDSLTIAKANQTINFATLGDATYGDPSFIVSATADSGLTVALSASGPCSLDSATSPANLTTTGAGSCQVTASQAGNSNYNAATNVVRTFNIGTANQTITFGTLADKTYGDADFDVSATATSGLTVTFAATGNCSMADADTVHISGAGSCSIKASQTGNANYNPAPDVTRTFNIAKASATVLPSNLSQTYDGTPKSASASTTPSGLTVTITYNASATAPTNAGSYALVATIVDANYQGSASNTFTIAKANQTITFATLPDTNYGDPDFDLSATSTSGLTVAFAATGSCSLADADTVHISGGGSCQVTASQVGNANYNAATNVVRTFNINKASQTISFATLPDKTYGDPDFDVSAVATSGLTVTFAATGNCSMADADTVHITGAGSCSIKASQSGNADYSAAPDVTQPFNIAKANQTITFATIGDATYGDADFGISATASSGLPVALGASGGCSLSSPTSPANVTVTGAGSCTITASQAGNGNYNAATNVVRTFNINKANQTISFATLPDKTVGNADFDVSATATSGLTVAFAASGNCSMADADTVHLTGAGSCQITASQPGDTNYNPASDVSHTFAIAKANQTISFATLPDKTFGNADFDVSATATSGLTVAFSASGNCSMADADTVHLTGAGSCQITAAQPGNSDYNAASPVAHTFTIAKAATSTAVVSSPSSIVYSQPISFTATVSSSAGVPAGGTVQFKVDGTNFGAPVAVNGSGQAISATSSSMAIGSHTVSAVYSGNADYLGSNGATSATVAKASVTVVLSTAQTPAPRNARVVFTVKVNIAAPATATPVGKVRLYVNGIQIKPARTLKSGVFVYSFKWTLGTGTFHLTARYMGNKKFNAAVSPQITQVITR